MQNTQQKQQAQLHKDRKNTTSKSSNNSSQTNNGGQGFKSTIKKANNEMIGSHSKNSFHNQTDLLKINSDSNSNGFTNQLSQSTNSGSQNTTKQYNGSKQQTMYHFEEQVSNSSNHSTGSSSSGNSNQALQIVNSTQFSTTTFKMQNEQSNIGEQSYQGQGGMIQQKATHYQANPNSSDFQFIQSLFNQPYMLTNPDMFKFREKIYLPQLQGINYVGLIIGPKGTYQKRLEEQTGCKILIRGKNSHKEGYPPQPDDDEEQHILILSDTEGKIKKAKDHVEQILQSDEQTRQQIRMQQLTDAQELSKRVYAVPIEDYLLTPYGPPSPHAYIIPVPNECVGLIIGKGGDTIRQIQLKSGARVQVAKKQIPQSQMPGAQMRNVFIEGSLEKYEKAKKLIEEIVEEHRKMHLSYQTLIAGVYPMAPPKPNPPQTMYQYMDQNGYGTMMPMNNPYQPFQPQFQPSNSNSMSIDHQRKAFQHHQEQCQQMQKQLEHNPFPGPHTYVGIPNKLTSYIIGHEGAWVKRLHHETGAYIFIPKDHNALTDERIIQLSGNEKAVSQCKKSIKDYVKSLALQTGIDLKEFKATKKLMEEGFKKVMRQKMINKGSSGGQIDENEAQEILALIKNETMQMCNQDNNGGNHQFQHQNSLNYQNQCAPNYGMQPNDFLFNNQGMYNVNINIQQPINVIGQQQNSFTSLSFENPNQNNIWAQPQSQQQIQGSQNQKGTKTQNLQPLLQPLLMQHNQGFYTSQLNQIKNDASIAGKMSNQNTYVKATNQGTQDYSQGSMLQSFADYHSQIDGQ
eukprot:403345886